MKEEVKYNKNKEREMQRYIRYCTICIILPFPFHSQRTLYIIRNMLPQTGTGPLYCMYVLEME